MDKNVEVIDSDTIDNELEDVLDCLPLEHPMSQLNQGIKWDENDFDELTDKILTDEVIIHGAINPIAPENVDSDEDDVNKTNNISWNQALMPWIHLSSFFKHSSYFNNGEITKLRIVWNDFLKEEERNYYKTNWYSRFA